MTTDEPKLSRSGCERFARLRADRSARRPRVARAARTRGRSALCRGPATTPVRVRAERNDRQAIEVREADVAQRGGNAPRHVELGRLGHRAADIEHQVNRQVALFVEETKQQAVERL